MVFWSFVCLLAFFLSFFFFFFFFFFLLFSFYHHLLFVGLFIFIFFFFFFSSTLFFHFSIVYGHLTSPVTSGGQTTSWRLKVIPNLMCWCSCLLGTCRGSKWKHRVTWGGTVEGGYTRYRTHSRAEMKKSAIKREK